MFSGQKVATSPTGRMIQGHTVIMFKDTDSAQFSLVKLEQSVLESKKNPLLWLSCAIERVCFAVACDHLLKGLGVI